MSAAIDEKKNRHFGKDCPVGMVQVEFVGVSPELRQGQYGYMPSESAFLEVYVDGQRFRIDIGNIGQHCFDGKERRGIHINYPMGAEVRDRSMNACNISLPDTPNPKASP